MATVQPWTKRIMQFQPSALRSLQECEHHYLEVHSAWAVSTFRRMDDLISYETNLMLRQWDIRGGFGQAPDLWRFASMRSDPVRGMEFPPGTAEMLSHDHQNFLRELRRFDVEEFIWLDMRSGQLNSSKYVLVLDRPPGIEGESARAATTTVIAGLAELLASAYGARLMVANLVKLERENVAMREPGQRPTGIVLGDTRRIAFVEIWFDDQVWGDEFFAREDVRSLIFGSVFTPGSVAGYHVLARTLHDRRSM